MFPNLNRSTRSATLFLLVAIRAAFDAQAADDPTTFRDPAPTDRPAPRGAK